MQTLIELLKLWRIKLEKISAVSIIIVVGMSFSCEVVETFKTFFNILLCF